MSQPNPVATSSSSPFYSTKRYKIGQGNLSWAPILDGPRQFRRLDSVSGNPTWNVHNVVLDFGVECIEICQKNQGNRCTVKYLPNAYGDPKFKKIEDACVQMVFEVKAKSVCTFAGDEDIAKNFPLAKLFDSFKWVQINFRWDDFRPKFVDLYSCWQELVSPPAPPISSAKSKQEVAAELEKRIAARDADTQQKIRRLREETEAAIRKIEEDKRRQDEEDWDALKRLGLC